MKRVLITGSAGHIGRVLREGLKSRYPLIRLADIAAQAPAQAGEEIVKVDITDPAQLAHAMEGIDCVVHLAGIADEDTWERIHRMNIEGCYNVFEAARVAGVKRVIFASSNHAVGFHRRDRMIDDQVTPRPDSRYGVSKVFGEAVGRLYADKYGLSVACLRIGSFRPDDKPTAPRHLYTWISHRDTVQLVQRAIDHPDYHFVVAYGVSNNARNRWDNSNARLLGYRPQDDAERYASEIVSTGAQEDEREALFHGGFGCLVEFAGTVEEID